MDVTDINLGIPRLFTLADGRWERTWKVTFATRVVSQLILAICRSLSDDWIEVIVSSVTKNKATVTLRSGRKQEYVQYWDNSFRIMLLLSKQLAFIEQIEGRERTHWRRFFFQADHEATLERYKTPLMIAARNGDKKTVIEKTKATNQIDEQSFSGKTSLMYAVQYGHREIVIFLLDCGATVTLSEPDWTPLQLATMSGSVEIVRLLLEAGAEINRQNYYGETALMWAAASGPPEIIELLLRQGARLDLSDNEGSDVHDWAAKLLLSVVKRNQYERIDRVLKSCSR